MALIDPVTGAGTSQAAVGQAKDVSRPIENLDNNAARVFTHVHPVLLLAVYFRSFSKVVEDPISTLAVGILPLVLIQTAWCVICLPPAGSTEKGKGKKKTGVGAFKGNDARGKKADDVGPLEKVVVAIPVILFLQILLGAPLTTHIEHTILSSAHMSILAVFPLIYVYGADTSKWLEIAGLQCPLDEVFGGTVGVLLGAWLGAVPIPLDWDREWQKWPVTIVTGAYLGFVVGKTIGKWGLLGRRIQLE